MFNKFDKIMHIIRLCNLNSKDTTISDVQRVPRHPLPHTQYIIEECNGNIL